MAPQGTTLIAHGTFLCHGWLLQRQVKLPIIVLSVSPRSSQHETVANGCRKGVPGASFHHDYAVAGLHGQGVDLSGKGDRAGIQNDSGQSFCSSRRNGLFPGGSFEMGRSAAEIDKAMDACGIRRRGILARKGLKILLHELLAARGCRQLDLCSLLHVDRKTLRAKLRKAGLQTRDSKS